MTAGEPVETLSTCRPGLSPVSRTQYELVDDVGDSGSPDGDVVLEVGLGCGADLDVLLIEPGEQGDRAPDLGAGGLDHPFGQLALGGPVAHLTQNPPAGEPLDQVRVLRRQRDQHVVQPTDRPLDACLVGRKDTEGRQQVPDVEVAPGLWELVEGPVADLDLATGHGAKDRGPSPGARRSQ